MHKGLENRSALKPEYVRGMDLLVVRELVGGAYFGRKHLGKTRAFDVIEYDVAQIERVLNFAFEASLKRKRKVTLAQANVLLTSVLWKSVWGQGAVQISLGPMRRLRMRTPSPCT